MICHVRSLRSSTPKLSPNLKEIAVMVVTVLVSVAILAVAMGGLDTVRRVSTLLSRPPIVIQAPAADPAGDIELAKLVGRWLRGSDGVRLLVSKTGEVWSDSGKMEGTRQPTTRPDANFAFGDGHYLCTYAVVFVDENRATWTLLDHTDGTPCPSGPFERPFAY